MPPVCESATRLFGAQAPAFSGLRTPSLPPSPRRCLPHTSSSVEDPEHEAPVPPRHSPSPSPSAQKGRGRGIPMRLSHPSACPLYCRRSFAASQGPRLLASPFLPVPGPGASPCPGTRAGCLPHVHQGQATTEGRRWMEGWEYCYQSAMNPMMPCLPRPAGRLCLEAPLPRGCCRQHNLGLRAAYFFLLLLTWDSRLENSAAVAGDVLEWSSLIPGIRIQDVMDLPKLHFSGSL